MGETDRDRLDAAFSILDVGNWITLQDCPGGVDGGWAEAYGLLESRLGRTIGLTEGGSAKIAFWTSDAAAVAFSASGVLTGLLPVHCSGDAAVVAYAVHGCGLGVSWDGRSGSPVAVVAGPGGGLAAADR